MTILVRSHLSTERLHAALQNGFPDDRERWRAILHLGPRRCPTCCRRLRKLARRVSLPPKLEGLDQQFDPVTTALRRRLALLAAQDEGRPPAALEHLWPIHRFSVENPHHPRWGLPRLVLEESRHRTARRAAGSIAVARSTLALMTACPRVELGAVAADLEGLAHALLGERLSRDGSIETAAGHFLRASRILQASSDPEPRVTLHELWTVYFYETHLIEAALLTVSSVEDLARQIELETRHGEYLLRLAQALGKNERWQKASVVLRQALSKLPPERMLNLRFEAVLLLAQAEMRCDRLDVARRCLDLAAPLCERHADALGVAHYGLLKAELELASGNPPEASEQELRAAISLFWDKARAELPTLPWRNRRDKGKRK